MKRMSRIWMMRTTLMKKRMKKMVCSIHSIKRTKKILLRDQKKNIGVQVRHDYSQTPSISSSLAHSASGVPPAPPPPVQASAALVHQVSISDRHRPREYTQTTTIGEMEDPSEWLLLQNQPPIVHAESQLRPQSVLHHRYYNHIRPPSSTTAESSSSTTLACETSLNHLLDYIRTSRDQAVFKTFPRASSLLENRDFIVEIHPRNKWTQREFIQRQFINTQSERTLTNGKGEKSGSHLETEV
ncbi:uncharacterized protein [Lepeophtheirus salmonis]|uniref:uncharacterized protein n=1 Tax=Lepeophtheirus salmonis TaxID=72036 RepID=UPI001AE8EF65|nr:uncharacterized protein LOC121118847 [Lepeophtheirus salmonis]